jgi:hypothetical protein
VQAEEPCKLGIWPSVRGKWDAGAALQFSLSIFFNFLNITQVMFSFTFWDSNNLRIMLEPKETFTFFPKGRYY